jgi:hypothetical protein
LAEGVLGHDIEAEERQEVQAQAKEAANAAKDAVWADYRFIVFTDNEEPDRLRAIDLGAGHSSSNETTGPGERGAGLSAPQRIDEYDASRPNSPDIP